VFCTPEHEAQPRVFSVRCAVWFRFMAKYRAQVGEYAAVRNVPFLGAVGYVTQVRRPLWGMASRSTA
jgi:hypothetical protein